jgi:hypothetical protein
MLWFRLSRRPGEELEFFPRPGPVHVIICINQGGYWKFVVGESPLALFMGALYGTG